MTMTMTMTIIVSHDEDPVAQSTLFKRRGGMHGSSAAQQQLQTRCARVASWKPSSLQLFAGQDAVGDASVARRDCSLRSRRARARVAARQLAARGT
jgi:hypothetical protein